MKRYLSKFELSYEFVKYSIYDCLDGSTSGTQRWTRCDTSLFLAEYVIKWVSKYTNQLPNKEKVAKKIRYVARHHREALYKLVDYVANEMYFEIKDRKIQIQPIMYEERYDASSKKIRNIGIACMKQQCYDYIAVNACKKMFLAKIGHYQCASLVNKGQVFGKNAIETWIRTNPNKCK